jgi:uncharacterized protein YodC (DUF2158 family)
LRPSCSTGQGLVTADTLRYHVANNPAFPDVDRQQHRITVYDFSIRSVAVAKPLYEIGDIVHLKSGGPDMTVERVIPSIDSPELQEFIPNAENFGSNPRVSYRCQWFAGKKAESDVFPEASLQPSDHDDKAKKKG